jgi:DNA-binding PadR family transcriptional regulator
VVGSSSGRLGIAERIVCRFSGSFLSSDVVEQYELWEIWVWCQGQAGLDDGDLGAMSAKHAILGLVIERPGYGYQLAQRLEERCGPWKWESTGVYSALDQLEREGHVLSDREKSAGATGRGAPRVIYESTPKGVDFFRDWILSPSPPRPARQELDLKILLSGPEFLGRLIEQTWAQEQQCMDELRDLRSTSPIAAIGPSASWREAAVVVQRDAEIKLLQVRIEWLQDTRKAMRQILDRDAGQPPG